MTRGHAAIQKRLLLFFPSRLANSRGHAACSQRSTCSPFSFSPHSRVIAGNSRRGRGGGGEHEKAISMHTAATHARTRPGRRRAICIEYSGLCCTEKSRKTCTSRDPFLPSGYTQYVYCRQHILGRYKCGHERPSCVRGKKKLGDNVSGGGGGGGKGRRSYLHCMDLCLYSLRSFISVAVCILEWRRREEKKFRVTRYWWRAEGRGGNGYYCIQRVSTSREDSVAPFKVTDMSAI